MVRRIVFWESKLLWYICRLYFLLYINENRKFTWNSLLSIIIVFISMWQSKRCGIQGVLQWKKTLRYNQLAAYSSLKTFCLDTSSVCLNSLVKQIKCHLIIFFSQWRKNINRRHTIIKCGFENLTGNVELQRVGKACES